MSEIVISKRPKKAVRLEKIIEGLKDGKTYYQIAQDCGCTERTINRDIVYWKDNGGFDKWLLSEFMRLHAKELSKDDGGLAYRCVSDLLKKRLKEEVHAEGSLKLDVGKDVDALIRFSREEEPEEQEAVES